MLEETPTQIFSVNIAKFLRTTFLIEHVWWLLLDALMENTDVMIFDHINKFMFFWVSHKEKMLQKDFPPWGYLHNSNVV